MEELYKCKCGCTQFITVTPHQYRKEDFNNWASFGLKAYAGIAPVLQCLTCGRLVIPPISMAGRKITDPNVQAFKDLIEWVEKHNQDIENASNFNQCGIDPQALEDYIQHMDEDEPPGLDGGEVSMGKLDKQTVPTKEEKFPSKVRNEEPRNKTKGAKSAKPKVKRQKNPSTTSKDSTNV